MGEIILKDGEIAISKSELIKLLSVTETQKVEIKALYDGSIQVMELIGLAKDGKIKAECFEEGGNVFSEIIKGASDIFALVMKAQAPMKFIAKPAEEKLQEKFSFVKTLIPLFIKYGNEYSTK